MINSSPKGPKTRSKQFFRRPAAAEQTATVGDRDVAVLIIEDHQTIAELLSDFVDQQDGFRCVGTANSGKLGISLIESLQPDMIMLDLQLGDISGLEVLEWINCSKASPKVFIFSALLNVNTVGFTLRSKVDAFVEKGVPMSQLKYALQSILRGEIYFSPAASQALRQIVHTRRHANLESNELRALRLIGQNCTVKSISQELGLSQSGTYKVVDRLLRKTKSKNNSELMNVAVGLGLVEPGLIRSGNSDTF